MNNWNYLEDNLKLSLYIDKFVTGFQFQLNIIELFAFSWVIWYKYSLITTSKFKFIYSFVTEMECITIEQYQKLFIH